MTLEGLDAQLAIRWLHVVAATVMVGGALLLAAAPALWRAESSSEPSSESSAEPSAERLALSLELFRGYEWAFWAAIGPVVATGVGNLGAFGSGLAAPQSLWGRTLTIKLAAVLVLMLLSLTRTLVVVRLPNDAAARSLLRGCYVVTAALTLGVLALAGALAHG